MDGLAQGRSYREIARLDGVAVSTVRSQLHAAYRKLGVSDRGQAVALALLEGWVAIEGVSSPEAVMLAHVDALLSQLVRAIESRGETRPLRPEDRAYLEAFDRWLREGDAALDDRLAKLVFVLTHVNED